MSFISSIAIKICCFLIDQSVHTCVVNNILCLSYMEDHFLFFSDFSDSVGKSRTIGYFADKNEYELVCTPICILMTSWNASLVNNT